MKMRLVNPTTDRRAADFEARLQRVAVLDDDSLSDIIADEAPRGPGLELSLFLRAVPDIRSRPVVLDCAIEVCLESRAILTGNLNAAAEGLAGDYPELREEIEIACRLGSRMLSTTELVEKIANPEPLRLPLEVGPSIGRGRRRYQLQQCLGAGSEGAVYLALDLALSPQGHQTWVAVKRLHAAGSHDEAAKARRVNHENVVRSLDAFDGDHGETFYVFEHVPGGTLQSLRDGTPGRFDARTAVQILIGVASGVQAAHTVGLVHRDLKPGNILMVGGIPKIADFGIAQRVTFEPKGESGGSFAFKSPQQFRDYPASQQDDVYSLGAILFWLLTGSFANGATVAEALARLSGDGSDLPQLRHLRPDLDADLEAICRRALEFEAGARYRSADAMIADMRLWLEHRPLGWSRSPIHRRLGLSVRRHPILWLGGVAAAGFTTLGAMFVVQSMADAEARKQQAELSSLRIEQDVLKDRANRAAIAGTLVQTVLIQSRPDSVASNWINAATFLEAAAGSELFGDAKKNQLLWDKRIDLAEIALERASEAGTRDSLESLLIESSLCVWLIRSERGTEAIEHIDRITPIWRRLLQPEDAWLKELAAYRAGAAVVAVNQADAQADRLRRERLQEAEAAVAKLQVVPRPIELMMERLRELTLGKPAKYRPR
ncbi:MAG TPA: serine/threonine-protein kinase [Phycisphaerales bacterium]